MSNRRTAARRNAPAARGAEARVLRIIGGTWRGRKLRFPAGTPVRPTPDRVRETLFNWLGARVAGARCLDLFAGSGALGLEALSRGAAHVTFVELDATAARALGATLEEWGAQSAEVRRSDARLYLGRAPQAFDLVFLDPPFDSQLLPEAAALLEQRGWLAPGALVYVESAARAALPPLPAAWTPLKGKRAGEVGYHLYARA
ncbi:MAG: 16S rRNA (guanine(966)-N(2))-methyltransferase RsmD [Steroidobacteraceae bacterium]